MSWWSWVLIALAAMCAVALITALSIRRSRAALTELARLIPACLALMRDVMRDPGVPKRAKIAPAVALAYIAMPFDVIPDVIPGLGQLDDALVIAWALRNLVASAGRERVVSHWRGDPRAIERLLRLARVP